MKNTKSKKSTAGYLEKIWDDHGLRSTFYFNLWGYFCKDINKRMTIQQLYEQLIDRFYTAQDIFVEDDPDDFISNFGGRDFFLGDWGEANLPDLYKPSFELSMKKIFESEDPEKQISPIVYGFFLIYSLPFPNSAQFENLLFLHHNTLKLYEAVQVFMFLNDIILRGRRQTSTMNQKKKRLSKIREQFIFDAEKKLIAKHSNYMKLSNNRKAQVLAKILENPLLPISTRTIRRKLMKEG